MVDVKSILFTLAVVFLGLVVVAGMAELDGIFGVPSFQSPALTIAGWVILALGALFRFWPTRLFYANKMKVVALKPQQHLLTSGPYRISRNPLYLGLVLILLGWALIAGSINAIVLTGIVVLVFNLWAKVEERQLEVVFGEEYRQYKARTRRWV